MRNDFVWPWQPARWVRGTWTSQPEKPIGTPNNTSCSTDRRDKPLTHAEHFYESIHPDDVPRVREAAAQAEMTGSFSQEFRVIAQDGSIRWLSGHGAAVRNDQGQAVRMVGINYDITRRKHVEEALQRSASDLEQRVVERTLELSRSREQLRALATELNLAGQRERQHLATELHDYLAQLLALSRIRLAQAKQQPMTTALGKILSELQDVMDQALTYTRTLVAQLSPPILKEFGLPMALKWLAEQMIQRDLKVSLELGTEHLALPEDQAMLLFQSVRELLMNIVKHASAKQARITVKEEEGWLSYYRRGPGPRLLPSGLHSCSGLHRHPGLWTLQHTRAHARAWRPV
jgi:signal transduction histidine kinase